MIRAWASSCPGDADHAQAFDGRGLPERGCCPACDAEQAIVFGTEHLRRAANDWIRVAKERVAVKAIGRTIYAFGSELAVLRLYRYYLGAHNVEARENSGDHQNLGPWIFRLELALGTTFGEDWIAAPSDPDDMHSPAAPAVEGITACRRAVAPTRIAATAGGVTCPECRALMVEELRRR